MQRGERRRALCAAPRGRHSQGVSTTPRSPPGVRRRKSHPSPQATKKGVGLGSVPTIHGGAWSPEGVCQVTSARCTGPLHPSPPNILQFLVTVTGVYMSEEGRRDRYASVNRLRILASKIATMELEASLPPYSDPKPNRTPALFLGPTAASLGPTPAVPPPFAPLPPMPGQQAPSTHVLVLTVNHRTNRCRMWDTRRC